MAHRSGSLAGNYKHGMTGTPEHQAWQHMKQRCLNPNSPDYPTYGAVGIAVCPAWMTDFPAFFREIGPRPSPAHSVDREDGTKGYEPGNVRWATAQQQSENRPGFVKSVEGRTAIKAAKAHSIVPSTLYARLSRGMTVEKALSPHPLPSGKPRLITHQGQTKKLKEWAKEMGLNRTTLGERLNRGWPVEKALTTPA